MRIPLFLTLPGDAMLESRTATAAGFLRRLRLALRQWNDERRTMAEFGQLDPATLRDIGVDAWHLRAPFRSQRQRAHAGAWQGRP